MSATRPVVLSFSGHDPCGGAGIQADIETLASHQCHAVNIVTALTEQDTRNVVKLIPQTPENIVSQANRLLADIPINVFKIGLLGSPDTVKAVHSILAQHPSIPVVVDPVLASGGGTDLASSQLIQAIVDLFLPVTTVLTPNSTEARRLTDIVDLEKCGLDLLRKGCEYVLITGTHETTTEVKNQLFHSNNCIDTRCWNRLPHSYHGSGCTLASSIAALIAKGLDITQAVIEAQEFTWNSLNAGYRPGRGQHLPNRFFWVEEA